MNPHIERHLTDLYVTNEYGITHPNPLAKPHPELIEHFEQEYGIRTDVHMTCIACQIRQMYKYKDFAKKDEKPKFDVTCNFIPKGLPPGTGKKIRQIAAKNAIDIKHARRVVLSTIDPVAWSELMLGFDDDDPEWFLRSYQKELIRCTGKRVSMVWGRRSGKSFGMAIKLIFLAYNKLVKAGRNSQGEQLYRGPKIYVITPFQSQLTNIFNDIESLIKKNPELVSMVKSGHAGSLYTKSPTYNLVLRNGATITGFVSGIGVKSDGSGGGTLRGGGADYVYLDEMDMIPEEILSKVIIPILHTSKDGSMYATSTPIGKRGRFFQWTNQNPKYKSDHYPSSVLPHWESIKEEAREEAGTEENFMAEYMAMFIEGGYGVFRPSLIHAARADYEYAETQAESYPFWSKKMGIPDFKNMSIMIGIDWNKNAGTEFYVIGYSHSTGRIVALESHNISTSEFSGKKWMEEVLRLNFKWKPSFIYADEGWGHHIIEDLQYHASQLRGRKKLSEFEKQSIQLLDRLVSFNFSKKVVLRSPIDGKKFEKSGKHFLVENAVRILEAGAFSYPENDKVLTDQFTNYVILRRHPSNNKPVYGCNNDTIGDHRLDAVMLALAAVSLECSDFSPSNHVSSSLSFKARGDAPGDYVHPIQEAHDLIESAKRAGVPAILNVLALRRGNNPQDEEHIRKKWAEEEKEEPVGRFKRSRERGKLRGSQQKGDNLLYETMSSSSGRPSFAKFSGRKRRVGSGRSSGRGNIRRVR
jgi:hypothetical protein